MPGELWWAMVVFMVLGGAFLLAVLPALWSRRPLKMIRRLLLGLLFVAVAAVLAAVGLGVRGYRALIYEELAATVRIEPVESKRFRAHFRFADGRMASF